MALTVELNYLSVASWMLEVVAEKKTLKYATYSHYDYNNRILFSIVTQEVVYDQPLLASKMEVRKLTVWSIITFIYWVMI